MTIHLVRLLDDSIFYGSFRFGSAGEYLGRNGMFKMVGIEATLTGDGKRLMLEPINSRNETGRAMLDVPVTELKRLIELLEHFIPKETATP